MDVLVRVDDVTKRYVDGPPAVDAVSLHIAARESVAIMGPSGSGKSDAAESDRGTRPADQWGRDGRR